MSSPSPARTGGLIGVPPTPTADIPDRPTLLILLAHRLARMHGAWRIHAPEEHHLPTQTELDAPMSIVPLITAVLEVLGTIKMLSLRPPEDGEYQSARLANMARDHAVRVTAVVRSLDSENRVEWYRKALAEGTATHRSLTLGGLISGGKQGVVFEFGSAVADLFLRAGSAEDEEYEYEEEEGDYADDDEI